MADLRAKFRVAPGPRPFPPYDEVLGFLEDADESLDLVVPLVDGRLSHVLSLFDGLVLTERATALTSGRNDLWASPSLAPLIDLVAEAPLALADGGQLERSPVYAQVLLGPPGWLPVLARHTTYDDTDNPQRRIDITHSLAIARQEAPDLLSSHPASPGTAARADRRPQT